jgi:hypothetical protein
MPDNNPSDGPVGGDGTANPNTSQPADSPPSIDAAEIFNALQGYDKFQQFVKSQAQSKHDKRISKIEETLGLAEQMAQVDELEAQGLPRNFAIQWLETQSKLAQGQPEVQEPSVAPVAPAGQQVAPVQDDPVTAVAKDLGLDPNSADVLSVRQEGGSEVEQIRKITSKFAGGQAVQPNPAATMTTTTGQPAQQPNLQAQYEAERDALGLGKPIEFNALKEKYRKQGLDIL